MKINKKQMHIACSEDDIGKYCILPGDPGRCATIAKHLDNAQKVAQNREFTTYTGTLLGEPVSICSTGIGGPSASIAMEELIELGATTFIRIGTCGGIAPHVSGGDIVIAQSAVRQEGTSREYMPIAYPATANFEVTTALVQACSDLGFHSHVGVIQSKDSFYGQHAPESMPLAERLLQQWDSYKKAGVLASEMESAALFVVAAVRGVRCGSILSTIWNQEAGTDRKAVFSTENAILATIEAMKKMIQNDSLLSIDK